MKQIEVKAKSVHEAIEEAAEKLGVSQDELNVEVLSQGGMFGKAKILASVKEDVKTKKVAEAEPVAKPVVSDSPAPTKLANADESKPSKKDKSVLKTPVADATPPLQKGELPKEPKKVVEKKEVVSSVSGVSKTGGKFAVTTAFVKKLLELLETGSEVNAVEADDAYNINVDGGQVGKLIGKGGVTMNAIQTLVTSIGISNSGGDSKRVYVNIGDYREKRGDSLQSLAQKKAEYVKRTGRFVKLEPMNAKDRAIVHSALSGVEGIKTYSTGRDPFRCLCISVADKNEKSDSE
ncbi:MAG: KH domain-containing protein [Firmicutes bacterium]|nr:KH domain-containing protein [Bacillota bacterium]